MLNLITKKQKIILAISAACLLLFGGVDAYLYKTGRLGFKADTTPSAVLLSDNFVAAKSNSNIVSDADALSGTTDLQYTTSLPKARSIAGGCQSLTADYPVSQSKANTTYALSYGLKGTITGKQLTMRVEWQETSGKKVISNFVEKPILSADINSTNWTITTKILTTPATMVAGSLIFKPVLQCTGSSFAGAIDSVAVLRIDSVNHQQTIGKNKSGYINVTDYAMATIPLNTQIDKPLQSLNISGSGKIGDDYGGLNVVLQGSDGSENLVAEKYNFDGKGLFTFDSTPVETAILENINPTNLIIYSNDATWNIDNIKVVLKATNLDAATQQIITTAGTRDAARTTLRTNEAAAVASGINTWLKRNKQSATAAANDASAEPYSAKKILFGSAYMSYNKDMLHAYNSGYLVMNPVNVPKTPANMPQAFSWTNYNDENWLTSVKDQENCGSCYAFAAVGQIEAAVNLKYNQHLNADLSEQQAMCVKPTVYGALHEGGCGGGLPGYALDAFQNNPLWPETLNPYQEDAGSASCQLDQPDSSTAILGWEQSYAGAAVDTASEYDHSISAISLDYMKTIQKYGPIAVGFGEWDHAMLVVGWTTINGNLTWIIKNSWGLEKGVNLSMQKPTTPQSSVVVTAPVVPAGTCSKGWTLDSVYQLENGKWQVECYQDVVDSQKTWQNNNHINLDAMPDGLDTTCPTSQTYQNTNLDVKNNIWHKNCLGVADGGYLFYQTGGVNYSTNLLFHFDYHDTFPFHFDQPTGNVTPVSNIPSKLSSLAPAVSCVDNDGDGLYYWGLGAKPATCPANTSALEDCNDHNSSYGAADSNGNCQLTGSFNVSSITVKKILAAPTGLNKLSSTTNSYNYNISYIDTANIVPTSLTWSVKTSTGSLIISKTLNQSQISALSPFHTIIWNGLDAAGQSVPDGRYVIQLNFTQYAGTRPLNFLTEYDLINPIPVQRN